jgi:hypothetical protein
MEKALLVNVEDSFCQLFSYESNFVLLKFAAFFFAIRHQFVQIFFDIFKYKVGLVDYSNNFFEFDYVRMVHFPECLDFRELQALLPSAILFLQPFNRDDFFGFFVLCLLYISE